LGEKTREKEAAEKEERYQFEVKLQQMKIDSQSVQAQKYDKNAENAKSETGTIQAKLPKIEIEKFNGSPLDWSRFWNQFSETVDKRSIAPVNKLTYLSGYLGPKVKPTIEGLPFTPEGYNRAKSILADR
jgi:predicted ribosome quality control (RQC) complex YloA/Tae2 family protein